MAVTAAELKVKVSGDTKDAENSLKSLNSSVKESGGGLKGLLSTALGTFAGFSAANLAGDAVGFLKDQLFDSVKAGMDANRMDALLAQGLKSTHDASGMTTDSLDKLSTKIMGLTGIQDDSVKGAEQMLLTFTNIGQDVFPQATQAAADMATRMNNGVLPSAQQLSNQSIMLGKALNDPIKGITALQRVGVTFTAQQKDQIAQMMKAGDVAGAQKVILGELNKEFGGSAAAAGKANGGIAILSASFDDMKEKVGQAIIPILVGLMQAISPLVTGLGQALPGAIQTVQGVFQQWSPVLSAVADGAKLLAHLLLASLQPGLETIGKAFSGIKGPGGDVKGVVSDVTGLVQKLAPVVQQVGSAVGQFAAVFVTNVIPAAKQFGQLYAQYVSTVLSQFWNILKAILPTVLQFAGFFAQSIIPAALKLATAFQQNLLPIIQKLGNLIQTVVVPIIHTLVDVFEKDVWPTINKIATEIETKLMPPVSKLIQRFLDIAGHVLPILNPILQLLGWIFSNVIGPAIGLVITIIAGLVTGLLDVVDGVGNVLGWFGHLKDGIGDLLGHLGKLKDTVTNDIAGAFKGLASGVGNAFGNLWGIVKAPLNSIIGGLDTLISGLDGLQFNIPSWVPVIGGKSWSMNIPQIPHLAGGGKLTSSGDVLVGERGPERLRLPSGASVTPLPSGGASTQTGAPMTIILQVDGQTLANVNMKYMPGAVRKATGNRSF